MVTVPMRTRFDQFGKQMVHAALEILGSVETDAEVRPTPAGSTSGSCTLALTEPSGRATQTIDDQAFLRDTQDIVDTWRREAIQEGVRQGVAHALVEVYEARFGAMPEDLHMAVDDADDEPTILAWLRLAGTRSAAEIAAAIRSSRVS